MMMRSRVGMYTVRMVPSSLLRWHKYNLEVSFEIWKPSKNYFHFNVSSHNQADVGLPATKQIENQSFLLTWWNTGWDPLVRDSWASLAPAPQIHLNCPRTWTLVCLFLSLSFLLSLFFFIEMLRHKHHKLTRVTLALENLGQEGIMIDLRMADCQSISNQ